MQAFKTLTGLLAPLDRPNIDTDAIIPKQYLKSIERIGFGEVLFDEWRYRSRGKPGDDHAQRLLNETFVLNQERYQGAEILLTRENFGCGSSREHAPWALQQYGFKVIIAPSFADIFYNNAFKNGILLITLSADIIDLLFDEVLATQGYRLTVNLDEQTIVKPDQSVISFEVEAFRSYKLINGLDDIGITLKCTDDIQQYEQRRKLEAPWLFEG